MHDLDRGQLSYKLQDGEYFRGRDGSRWSRGNGNTLKAVNVEWRNAHQ